MGTNSMELAPMLYVRILLEKDESPWWFVKNTKNIHDTCGDISFKVFTLRKPDEREYMKKWLLDEKFWATVH